MRTMLDGRRLLSFKPTEQAVKEDQLLKLLKGGDKVTGRNSRPDGLEPEEQAKARAPAAAPPQSVPAE